MDTVEHVSVVDRIRKRLGMYWLTRDGIPDKSVWVFLLDQLANEMAEAFGRGEISYVDIRVSDADARCDSGCKMMSVECDGMPRTDDLQGICMGQVKGILGEGRNLGFEYAMINALSRFMEIETCKDGEWIAVQSVDGHVGTVERLFPALMDTAGKKLVRIRFIPSKDYYRMIDLNDDQLDEVVQGLGNGLAARCPGLAVSANGHQYIYDEGIQGYVKKHLESIDGTIFMQPRTSTCGNVSFSCGAVQRRSSIRRVFGKLLLNGRDVVNREIKEKIMRMAVEGLLDCQCLPSSGYDFVFAVDGQFPEMHFVEERSCCYSATGYVNDDDALLRQFLYETGCCMFNAFQEYMK